jgi:hypothetical protein
MLDERIPKNSNRKFQNKRPVGKTGKREKDVVWMDISQILGIRGWKRRAEDRVKCRRLPREARVRKGL